MANLVITSNGLNAIANVSQTYGFKLSIKTFKVTNYQYGTEDPGETLKGSTIVYSGSVSSIEVLSSSSVRYECTIPSGIPASGNVSIGEIGLYLDTGELFAVGKISPAILKDSSNDFRIYTILASPKLGGVIDVTVSDKANLPKTAIDILPVPDQTANALIVSDAEQSYDTPYTYPSIAVRYGPSDDEWAFIGWNKVAKTQPDTVYSLRSFSLNPNLNGFWLNDGENVLVQVIDGPGKGQTKSFKFNKSLATSQNVFEAKTDFSDFSSASVLVIWRNDKESLPDRRGVPSTQVLFAGENSTSSFDTASPEPGKLKVKSAYFMSIKNQYIYDIPANIPRTYYDKNNILLFIDGILQGFNDFNIYDNKLITSPSTKNGQKISLYVFYRENGVGSNLKLYEEVIQLSQLVNYNGKPSFNLPIVPESVEDSLGFTFSRSQGTELPHNWTFDGARLVFNTNPATDTLFLVWGQDQVDNGYSTPKQYEWTYNQNNSDSAKNQHIFKISATPQDSNYMLFVRGQIVPKSIYAINNNIITISKSNLAISAGDTVRFVWILNKISTNAEAVPQKVPVVPNKLIPSIKSYVSPSKYTITPAINDNYCFVFVKGLKQEKNVDWKLKGTSEIIFIDPIPDQYPVDILTFSEDTNNNGYVLNCEIYSVKTEANKSLYSIPYPLVNSDHLLVFIDGLYFHKSDYSLTINSGNFVFQVKSALPPVGCTFEFVIFNFQPLDESRTDLVITNPLPHIGFRTFETESITGQQNTLLFLGPLYQHKDSYKVRENEVILNRSVPYSLIDPDKYNQMEVELYSFVSGKNMDNLNIELAALAKTTKVAQNTGPYWADPAGINRNPNRMDVSVSTYVSGPAVKYLCTPPTSSSNILVFIQGALQYKDIDYVFLSLGQIAFTSKIPDGYPVDIITFQTTEDAVGYQLDMKVFQVLSNNTNNYTINFELDDEQKVFVFVEGLYFHKSWYKIVVDGNKFSLQFNQGLMNGLHIEVVIWDQFQSPGSYTEMNVQLPNPAIGAKNIVLDDVVTKNNTLVFAGPIYQSKSTYKVTDMTLLLDAPVSYEYIDPINFKDLPITICGFRTGVAQTRLVTRDELKENYLTKYGGDLRGPLYTSSDPESDLEVVNKRYVDSIKQQLEAMQSMLLSLQGTGDAGSYSPTLSVAPNLIKIGDPVTIKITNAPPGKSVELEVRGSSGVYNARSIKGITKLDGTFTLGPVGIDNGYVDYLTITAWVDGFRVINTVDIKVTDGRTITGPAMLSCDKDIYYPYDYITYAIADGTPGGRVTWSINGAAATAVPAGQPQYIGSDGTWSMQVPAGGVPTNYIVEFFIDDVSVGTLNIIISPVKSDVLPTVTFSATEIYRDEVLEVQITNAKAFTPVTFSAKAIGMGRAGPVDTAGLIGSDGTLNFGFRFTSAGDYVIYVTINRNLFTHSLSVKQVSPNDTLITEQPEGYRAYIKQY